MQITVLKRKITNGFQAAFKQKFEELISLELSLGEINSFAQENYTLLRHPIK